MAGVVNTGNKKNYLSRLLLDTERRRSVRHHCFFHARACYFAHGARGISEVQVTALDISEHGVRLRSNSPDEIPLHFYLTVGHYQNNVACAVVQRNGDTLRCDFIRAVRPEFVEFLCGISDPGATLEAIRHPLFQILPEDGGSRLSS